MIMSYRLNPNNFHLIAPFIFCSIILYSCKKDIDYKEIDYILSKRIRAIEDKDINMYLSTVADDYNYNGENFNDIKKKISYIMNSERTYKIINSKRKIDIKGNVAVAIQTVNVKIYGDELREWESKERIYLKKKKDRWIITGGL